MNCPVGHELTFVMNCTYRCIVEACGFIIISTSMHGLPVQFMCASTINVAAQQFMRTAQIIFSKILRFYIT